MTYNIGPEIEDYFWDKYDDSRIKVVPGHWPVMNTKEEVDKWIGFINKIRNLSSKDEKTITRSQVKDIFNDTYNVFYRKWENASNEEDILKMWEEAKELKNKYNDEYGLCETILMKLSEIIKDDFKRRIDDAE
ncbi:hypothetical protein [Anaerocolumna sp. MB42-C2]|uniref:hypothetical protein n=1 Tax=Anaerocolumna sp. MB42-C2 TaxID=3070997 RepID=UPI0027DED0D5|nr:hypothetical protein [Anaerocolumna sp. MB42-C2]WMJ85469.1 hypothetical protein RBU59_15470 [Anaerocolumna sp. MB42-C2]